MTGPEHVSPVTYVEATAVVQYIDRGLLVNWDNAQWSVHEVRIVYRWDAVSGTWGFKSATGFGYRRMPGTGYLGVTVKEVPAMHPDYRDLAQEFMPNWRPPDSSRKL